MVCVWGTIIEYAGVKSEYMVGGMTESMEEGRRQCMVVGVGCN